MNKKPREKILKNKQTNTIFNEEHRIQYERWKNFNMETLAETLFWKVKIRQNKYFLENVIRNGSRKEKKNDTDEN